MNREKDVSTRLIRPTIPDIHVDKLALFVERWNHEWEIDASIQIYDEGIAQYMLVDIESHYKFFAALILGKPSLRCKIVKEEPRDELDEHDNHIVLLGGEKLTQEAQRGIEFLKTVLHNRGYRFDQ
ncbi:unnamed protein product [Caenorhabditis bovis]|uniref:Uncharacterized protein n=1 Tax=Caenorhabditis bovis TaxID=2654633 RepID=A0A8S1FCT7_9PELO|nr:unnamed protein product [Caenorhabditis bovis]